MPELPKADSLRWAKIWIVLCAFLSCAGWLLSALGRLDAPGYAVVLAAGLLLIFCLPRRLRTGWLGPLCWGKARWRSRHFFPAFFLVLCGLAILGGALYAPNNYDAMTYRFPRILRWLAEGRWHWIANADMRMNVSGVGMEWLMVPLFVFTHSDRLFFLVNVASFALLPGLIYATFVRLGVSRRGAWYWMWLLPCGYCFATQAGSIGNDAFAAVYLLAALCLMLRFRETRRCGDLWMSLLAAALLTGAKTSNLPLLLPWALAGLPALRLLKGRALPTVAIVAICVLVSFLPLAWLNFRNTGDWAGDLHNKMYLKIDSPIYGILGNGLELLTGNVAPPVMLFPQGWNEMTERWLHGPQGQTLVGHFPRIGFAWTEFPNEEASGLGAGLFGLLVVSALAGFWQRGRQAGGVEGAARARQTLGRWVCLGAWVALAAYMAKLGSESAPRLIASYYPILVASVLLLPGVALLTRRRWWRGLAILAALSVLPGMVLTPSRPLWPALLVCQKITAAYPDNHLAARALSVYSVYRNRNDGLAPLRKYLAPEDKTVGVLTADASEVALWRPFGQRRVVGIKFPNQGELLSCKFPVIASAEAIQIRFGKSLEEWLVGTSGHLVATEKLVTKASKGAQDWYVIRFDPSR